MAVVVAAAANNSFPAGLLLRQQPFAVNMHFLFISTDFVTYINTNNMKDG